MASADVIWQCVKKQNAFLCKNTGVQFSKEKGNLMALNTFKYSGKGSIRPAAQGFSRDACFLYVPRD
eukprot:1192448-Prorocentrum_minimum.AAC.2